MQAKLLRIIQEKEFERLGSNKVIKADIRFVAASNKDLKKMISAEKFREDLFYRLNVLPIKLPPLRKRKRDIPLLLNHFIDLFAKKTGNPPKNISDKAIWVLQEYDWPGNVRELKNLVERLLTITTSSIIRLEDVSTLNVAQNEVKDVSLKEAVRSFEKRYISETLESVNGSRKRAAELLGVHRNTLLAKTNEFGLSNKGISSLLLH
jgi:transcriptional regulator with PAS, ATPase and Fis domain